MSLAGQRVLVTGGAGFLGSHLVEHLLDTRELRELHVLDNLATGTTENLAAVTHDPRLVFTLGDVRDRGAVEKACNGADVVFHLACLGLRHSLHSPVDNHRVNAEGTLNVALEAARTQVGVFVHVSSSEVFGSAEYAPMDESHPTRPTTVYGAAKLAGEAAVQAIASTTGMQTLVVRPFNMFGPRSHAAGDAGEMIPRTIVRILRGLPPTVFGDGQQTRDFLHVRDTTASLVALSECDRAVGRTVNIGSGSEVTINRLCALITAALGRPDLVVLHEPDRPADLRRLVADTRLASELIDFRPSITFDDGLAETIEWFSREQGRVGDVPSRNWGSGDGE
jgi:UDP-glucose 4-epimerase